MSFSPELADIRFGCGLSPVLGASASEQALLNGLTGPDVMETRFPVESFDAFRQRASDFAKAKRAQRKNSKNARAEATRKTAEDLDRAARFGMIRWYARTAMRWAWTEQGFRERLAAFWGDHFTAVGKMGVLRRAASPYVDSAIRPNMTGTFADLLIATTTHPLMLNFLDQWNSIGPQSQMAGKAKKLKGLNENLAREVLELHTLGVNAAYSQDDVRQLAELFTGLTYNLQDGFYFRSGFAEPGAETVLGKTYGGNPAKLEAVIEALRDLAMHPTTAQHIAWKLAVHFVSDTPDPALVKHVAARFRDTGGALMPVYEALLEHPSAWDAVLANVKPPADFIATSCRALAVAPERMADIDERKINQNLLIPMRLMGQNWQRPGGPDGWPEEDTAWITPQGLSARVRWAVTVPQLLRPDLPDPRIFAAAALGPFASLSVQFAAGAAETQNEAIGLVLAAPAFQRR